MVGYIIDSLAYLLEPRNMVKGPIMGRAFEPLATQAQVTLFWVQELQRIKVALQNKLNQDLDAVHAGLIGTMQTKIVDYSSFVKVKRLLSIFTNSFRRLYLEFSGEFTTQ